MFMNMFYLSLRTSVEKAERSYVATREPNNSLVQWLNFNAAGPAPRWPHV